MHLRGRKVSARGVAHWTVYKHFIFVKALPQNIKVSGTSGKSERKGDVGMSRHEKERDQEDTYTKMQSHS